MAEATSSVREAPDSISEADAPRDSLLARFGVDQPLKLDAGVALAPFQIAYKTYAGSMPSAPTLCSSATR